MMVRMKINHHQIFLFLLYGVSVTYAELVLCLQPEEMVFFPPPILMVQVSHR